MTDYLIFLNPKSGQGKSEKIFRRHFLPKLQSGTYELIITQIDTVRQQIANRSLDELLSYRAIVVVSGDGLMYELINALMLRPDWPQAGAKPALGIIPTGSGNGLAHTLIKGPGEGDAISRCCDLVLGGQSCNADLVRIEYDYHSTPSVIWSFLSVGWGLLADIDIDSEWLRPLGEARFTLYGLLRSVTAKSRRARLRYQVVREACDEAQWLKLRGHQEQENWFQLEDSFMCLYAVYQSHISSKMHFAPKSTLDDQIIYLTYIRGKLSGLKMIKFLLAIEDGSHERLPYVTVVPVRQFTFQPLESCGKIVVDGEKIPWDVSCGPLKAQVVPKMMTLACASNPTNE